MPRPDYDSKSSKPLSHAGNWMARIPDDTSLTLLSVPGTHDTMATMGGPITRCQTWLLEDQLNAGIRFLDIRCRHYEDAFPIHHGMVYLKKNFDDVLKCMFRFLSRNPSEVILLRVKKEYKEEKVTREFVQTFKEYVERYGADKFWLETRMPRIKEVRGKVVILREFDSPGSTNGIPWGSAKKADQFKVPTVLKKSIQNKWGSILGNLEKAKRPEHNNDLYITFCSGASGGAYPNAVADRINPKLYKYLQDNAGRRRWGVVVLDFPGRELVQLLIDANL